MSEIYVVIFTSVLAIALFAIAFLILKQYNTHNKQLFENMKNYQDLMLKKIESDNKQHVQKATVSLRLQAYERMVLFLERINPSNLVIRVSQGNMTAVDLQSALLKVISDEYEHNLSQQLFISADSWNLIKLAKEEVVKSVNLAAAIVKPDDSAKVYAQEVMTKWFSNKEDAVEKALNSLKEDIRLNF